MRAPARRISGRPAAGQLAKAWLGALNLALAGDAVLSFIAVLIPRHGRHAKGPLAGLPLPRCRFARRGVPAGLLP